MRKTRKQRLAAKLPTTLKRKPELVQLKNLDYNPDIFTTLNTCTVVDEFFSTKHGIPKACNFILIGDPGVGKSTVALDMLCNVQQEGSRALFISAEMNEIDMYGYMERFPKFGNVDILFLADYTDENPKLVIESVLQKGYDIVLLDSFSEICEEMQEVCFMSSKGAEKWLIDLACKHNKAGNDKGLYTTFLMIQQMTKGGKFVGSNKLKHNTTGMLEIRFDGTSNNAPRYMEFSKNRRGDVQKRLYFTLDKTEDVNYLEDKWHAEEENRGRMENEIEALRLEAEAFDALLDAETEDAPQTDAPVEEVAAT